MIKSYIKHYINQCWSLHTSTSCRQVSNGSDGLHRNDFPPPSSNMSGIFLSLSRIENELFHRNLFVSNASKHLVGLYTTRLPVFRWKARGYDWILVDSIGHPSVTFELFHSVRRFQLFFLFFLSLAISGVCHFRSSFMVFLVFCSPFSIIHSVCHLQVVFEACVAFTLFSRRVSPSGCFHDVCRLSVSLF